LEIWFLVELLLLFCFFLLHHLGCFFFFGIMTLVLFIRSSHCLVRFMCSVFTSDLPTMSPS
jgi:hypothetical protein